MATVDAITADEARRMFAYDPETGILSRRIKTGDRTYVGQIVGSDDLYGYKTLRVGCSHKGTSRSYKVHRIAWLIVHGEWPTGDIDHINGNRSDNRLCNLRDVSRSVNLHNKRVQKASNSGYRGVYHDKRRNLFYAGIVNGRKKVGLGVFGTAEEASAAYEEAKSRHTPPA